MKNRNGFSQCAERYIGVLEKEGRHATAHVYRNALLSFTKFCGTASVSFKQVTRDNLRCYGQYLFKSRLRPNTVSTYMRMLRSLYNRGVECGRAKYIPRLFHDVYTGIDVHQKKALPIEDLHLLLYGEVPSETLRRTQRIASLMFQFCGMPFCDIAYLEKSSLDRNLLRYNRFKTGTPMNIEVLDTAKEQIYSLWNTRSSRPDCPDYLFNILSGDHNQRDEASYREYQSVLRRFNNHLKSLGKALGLDSPVTSYTMRHSWATTAKYRGVPIEMISESLGHKSIRTTQIYLKGFELEERTKINKMNCSYVKNVKSGRVKFDNLLIFK